MKKLMNFAIIIALVPLLFFTHCKTDKPEPTTDAYVNMTNYMKSNSLDLTDLLSSWIVAADPIEGKGGIVDTTDYTIPAYHVFDIRSAEDFNNLGHIKDAINTTLINVVTLASDYTDKPILVVCKTGQTAGHAVMALRLSGYNDAQVLKWGMASWNITFAGSWESNIGDTAAVNSNWVLTDAPATGTFANPTWTSSNTAGAAILAERVEFMLTGGFKGVVSSGVLDNPGDYQIHNYWKTEHYMGFGHINGAFQVTPGTLSLSDGTVNTIDHTATPVVYCYTGQTSSMITAWLNVLGYNVSSMKFGVNSLLYEKLSTAEPPAPHWHGPYDYVAVTN